MTSCFHRLVILITIINWTRKVHFSRRERTLRRPFRWRPRWIWFHQRVQRKSTVRETRLQKANLETILAIKVALNRSMKGSTLMKITRRPPLKPLIWASSPILRRQSENTFKSTSRIWLAQSSYRNGKTKKHLSNARSACWRNGTVDRLKSHHRLGQKSSNIRALILEIESLSKVIPSFMSISSNISTVLGAWRRQGSTITTTWTKRSWNITVIVVSTT